MNTVSPRIRGALFASCVLLLVLALGALHGSKEEDAGQRTPEQAATEQVGKTEATEKNDLMGSDGKIKLRILLTAAPEEERTADFVSFLSKHFVKVGTTDYKGFREGQAEDFDVVIFDYGATRPGAPTPKLTPEYSRATITFGAAGSMVCRRLRLKPDYL